MDEPLGALDAELRESMRAEIKNLHIAQHATTVYVTHDQVEAMAMGDRIVVMSKAEVQQVGTPMDVYYNPANLFVARFIGSPGMNLVKGRFSKERSLVGDCGKSPLPAGWNAALGRALEGRDEVLLGFRPEAARVTSGGAFAGEVYSTDMHGAYTVLHVRICGERDRAHPQRQADELLDGHAGHVRSESRHGPLLRSADRDGDPTGGHMSRFELQHITRRFPTVTALQ